MIDSSFKFAGIAGAMALAISASVVAQEAVQWRVEDGGNGHWYQETGEGWLWDEARVAAEAVGAHLASITTVEENSFISQVATRQVFLGGIANRNACVDENWSWITGEPFDLYLWHPAGNNYCGYELHLAFDDGVERWNNVTNSSSCCCCRFGAMFEWSADCNGDGIVDYGQILDGTFADNNANGVPDCCDVNEPCDPCLGDITGNGVVDAADLGILLAVWNTDGKSAPEADINGDGTVNAADLGILLGAWGPCP